jgi:hypothetical protein
MSWHYTLLHHVLALHIVASCLGLSQSAVWDEPVRLLVRRKWRTRYGMFLIGLLAWRSDLTDVVSYLSVSTKELCLMHLSCILTSLFLEKCLCEFLSYRVRGMMPCPNELSIAKISHITTAKCSPGTIWCMFGMILRATVILTYICAHEDPVSSCISHVYTVQNL